MAFLDADKVVTLPNGLKINQEIIPDSLVATKYNASWCKKGQKMKPCKKLNDGSGKPLGITVHNTADIKEAKGTNDAEQYARATYNENMSGVIVHFYVYDDVIWQLLNENERGWHATDGQTRRKSQRNDGSKIGGNLDTIAIECIGNRAKSEDTTAKLVAYLCKKYGLNPETDVYQHNYFYPSKNCPEYIRPHWSTFLSNVKKYYNELSGSKPTTSTPSKTPVASKAEIYRIRKSWKDAKSQKGAYSVLNNAIAECKKLSGYKVYNSSGVQIYPPIVSYYLAYKGTSNAIDTVLKDIGVPSKYIGSYTKRKPIAKANGISLYTGSASQNTKLVALAKQGKLKKV